MKQKENKNRDKINTTSDTNISNISNINSTQPIIYIKKSLGSLKIHSKN